ncbi:MAG: RagB/SusD family nutrient uptake outer membrane protein [Tannerella sp.]|nr:RagB/SusD family nutrient uptake outer membrane protein [Tannerella sp.]
MKMYKYIILLNVLLVSSCDYLDIIPDNIATIDMAFTTRANAEKFLATCYSYVPWHASVYKNPGMAAGDETWNSAEKTFYYSNSTAFAIARGLQNANSPYLNYWSGGNDGHNLFIAIRDCNIFLDNIGNVKDITSSEQDRWIAEVKVLKAYFHYFLMQLYGPVPIIDRNIDVSEGQDAVKVLRRPVDEVVKFIASLIDEAVASEGLPVSIKAETTELGRLTKPAALALKAKILTLAASPLFNGNPDFPDYLDENKVPYINPTYDPAKWATARDACKAAIDAAEEGGHALYEFDDYLPYGVSDTTLLELTIRNTITAKFNRELIWGLGNNFVETLQGIVNAPLTAYQQGSQISWTKSMQNPTLDVAEQFYSNNGVPIDEDITYDYENRYEVDVVPEGHEYYIQKEFRTARLHFNREPRFYADLGFDGGKWFTLEASSDINSYSIRNKAGETAGRALDNFSITGYFCKKLVNYKLIMTSSTHTGSTIKYPFPIIRLADLYLMYAEALNECMDAPNDEVYRYVQLVRDKAGLDRETGGLVATWKKYSSKPDKPLLKGGMREIIQRERLIELALEGQRFFDLRRWRLSMEYLNRPIRGWNVSESSETGYYQVRHIYFRKFTPRDYFWPVRTMDLYVNDRLVQSPLW